MQKIGSKGCWVFWYVLKHMIFLHFPQTTLLLGPHRVKTQTERENLGCNNANMEVCIKLSKNDQNENKAGVREIWESCDHAHEIFYIYTVLLTTQPITTAPHPARSMSWKKLHCPLPPLPLNLFLSLSLPLPVMLYPLVKVRLWTQFSCSSPDGS